MNIHVKHKMTWLWVVCLLVCAGIGSAQDLSGYTLQETVLVPVTGPAVMSQTALLSGVVYKLRALGDAPTVVPGPGGFYQRSDAEYLFDLTGVLTSYADLCPTSLIDVGVGVNDAVDDAQKFPNWGGFTDSHIYTSSFVGTGAPISLSYHNCVSVSGRNVLTVQILRPNGTLLPTSTAPTSTDVSPMVNTFIPPNVNHSVSGRMQAVTATADGQRLYAGSAAGVWRSDDRGVTWRQMTQSASAPFVRDVFDVAVSPRNADLVLVGAGSDALYPISSGAYRSVDGGQTWSTTAVQYGSRYPPQIVFAPDNPDLVYAVGGGYVYISSNGGASWAAPIKLPGVAWHIAVAPLETSGARRVYASGSDVVFYSIDGGQTWTSDGGTTSITSVTGFGDPPAEGHGASSRLLIVEPGNNLHVLMVGYDGANGPSFYRNTTCGDNDSASQVMDGTLCNSKPKLCGEGSLWLGDFTNFNPSLPTQHRATWTQLPGPPDYFGATTPSGNGYVAAKVMGSSYLLFFSDRASVHVSMGLPVAGGWHRLDGPDPSQVWQQAQKGGALCNSLFLHCDPHAVTSSSALSLTLVPPSPAVPAPYNMNKVIGPNPAGDAWAVSDGGIYHASGLLSDWQLGYGISTLSSVNIAGVAFGGKAPALYLGVGDNDNFYSLDGGATWEDPELDCGDCGPWFADPAWPRQVMTFAARSGVGGLMVYENTGSLIYPDVGSSPPTGSASNFWVCPADCNADTPFYLRGTRPVVLTMATETAPTTNDYLVIGTNSSGQRAVFRRSIWTPPTQPSDWVQFGPALPACPIDPKTSKPALCLDVVQSANGHAAPLLYVGDPATAPDDGSEWTHTLTLYKWGQGQANWYQIVPSPAGTIPGQAATQANRFFVDPFNPTLVYIVDGLDIKVSFDAGLTWSIDHNLWTAVTENGRFGMGGDDVPLKDMVFVRDEAHTYFAIGTAGAFYTLDGGNSWVRVLSSTAMPGHPTSAYFDKVTDACDRALYVGFDGRGVVRIDPIPSPTVLPQCAAGTKQAIKAVVVTPPARQGKRAALSARQRSGT